MESEGELPCCSHQIPLALPQLCSSWDPTFGCTYLPETAGSMSMLQAMAQHTSRKYQSMLSRGATQTFKFRRMGLQDCHHRQCNQQAQLPCACQNVYQSRQFPTGSKTGLQTGFGSIPVHDTVQCRHKTGKESVLSALEQYLHLVCTRKIQLTLTKDSEDQPTTRQGQRSAKWRSFMHGTLYCRRKKPTGY